MIFYHVDVEILFFSSLDLSCTGLVLPGVTSNDVKMFGFWKDLGDLPPPSALSLQTVRVKVEKRVTVDGVACTGSAVAAGCGAKLSGVSSSSSCVSPKSSPVGENRRDSRKDSRDSTVRLLTSRHGFCYGGGVDGGVVEHLFEVGLETGLVYIR